MECSVHRLVADVTPVAGRKVVLTRYRDAGKYDGERGWFLPDDLLEHGEHPDAEAEWLDLEGLPDRSQIAHHGWRADTLETILPRRRGWGPSPGVSLSSARR